VLCVVVVIGGALALARCRGMKIPICHILDAVSVVSLWPPPFRNAKRLGGGARGCEWGERKEATGKGQGRLGKE
jgi:hypothetical protein